MKLYFASLYYNKREIWEHEIPEKILLSYHYYNDTKKTLEYCKNKGISSQIEVIIDSGAFSCWNKGIGINIENYLDFILRVRDNYNFKSCHYVNLDVIPGKQGDKITKEMSYESMIKGWENYLWFKNKGIETIHVFHQGEDEEFLINTIIKECKYIGVSPSNDASTKQKMLWCERIFHLLPADVRSHGFAVTSTQLMKSFPWYSVDSASWCRKSGFGNILTSYGELVFSTKGRKSFLTNKNEALKELDIKALRQEFESYGIKFQSNDIRLEIESKLKLRNLINYKFLKSMETKLNLIEGKDDKYVSKQLTFF